MEENQKNKRVPLWAWLLGCLGLLVVCAVVVAVGAAVVSIFAITSTDSGAGFATDVLAEATIIVVPDETRTPPEQAPNTPETKPTVAATEAATQTAEPAVETAQDTPAAIDDPHAAERADIEATMAAIRQLEPKAEVKPVLLTTEELRQRLEDDLLEDYGPEEAQQEAIAMSAFDFMPADYDLYGVVLDLLTEEILGYYDPETDEFVIVSNEDGFDVLEQVTHAHEYVHALQDQYYNLELLEDDELDSEAAFAVQALAEGEATFFQSLFMIGGYFDAGQLLELMELSLTVDTAVLDSAPPILAHELEFPYLSGLEFIQELYERGGHEAIDAAWDDLPQSTEHILHPQRYLDGDLPQLVSLNPLTDTLGAGWRMADEDTLGEFYLREYLGQQLASDSVDLAATGWGGDRYAVYWHEENQMPVMVLKLVWDTPADAEEFAEMYPQYPGGLFGVDSQVQADDGDCWSGEDVICLFAYGGESLIVRAPDLETAALVAAVQRTGG